MTRWPALLTLLMLLPTFPVAAGGIQAEVDLLFLSSYVWRGGTMTDGAVFQHSLTLSGEASPWSANVWGNIDLSDSNGLRDNYQEVDLTVSYTFEFDSGFGAELGLAHYVFPHYDPGSTTECYLSLGWDLPVAPSLTIYYDFDQVKDFYANLGLGYGGELNESWSYELEVSIGHSGSDMAAYIGGGHASGFTDANAGVTLLYSSGNSFTFGSMIAYTHSLDRDVLPAQPVDLYGGFFLRWSF